MVTQKAIFHTSPGDMDTSFGIGGIATIEVPGAFYSTVTGVINGKDDSLYVCGTADTETGSRFFITVLESSGSINQDFGNKGFVIGTFGAAAEDSYAAQLVWANDEKLLLIGSSRIGLDIYPALAKFDQQGNIDPTFGESGSGKVVVLLPGPPGTHFSSESDSEQKAVKSTIAPLKVGAASLLSDGKILLSHYFFRGPAPSYGMVIQLSSNGSLDTEFNATGYLAVMAPGYKSGQTQVTNVTIDSAGRYLVCGGVNSLDSSPLNSFIARYTAQGVPDNTFGPDGFQIVFQDEVLPGGDRVELMVPLDAGGVLGLGGSIYEPYVGQLLMLEENGQMNPDFNFGAPLNTRLGESGTLWKNCTYQPDGKLVVVGAIDKLVDSFDFDIVIARFDKSGGLDSSFNSGLGWVRTRLGNEVAGAYTVLLQNNKIVVGGVSDSMGVVLRYQS